MLLLLLALAGCGKTGRLDEGNCKLHVAFVDIPRELSLHDENVQEQFTIRLTLKNISNDKLYRIQLDAAHDFAKDVSLHPGIYQVYTLSADQATNLGISIAADAESIKLTEENPESLRIYVDNAAEFTRHWMNVQPLPEMLLADKFDGLIQINRQIFDLHGNDSAALLSQLNVSYDKDKPVDAYQKIEVTDTDAGITLILQNQTDDALAWNACRVVGIYVTKNQVVFPQGVTLGMSPAAVCHADTGLFGEPDALTGSLLYGFGFDETAAVYNDPVTGDRITVTINADGTGVRSIRYELAQFE